MGIARPVMEQAPWAWAFFITFILFATFTMLNLFIAIIVNAMQTFQESEHDLHVQALDHQGPPLEQALHQEVTALRQELQDLKSLLVQQLAASRDAGPKA